MLLDGNYVLWGLIAPGLGIMSYGDGLLLDWELGPMGMDSSRTGNYVLWGWIAPGLGIMSDWKASPFDR